jgi:5-(carboxyamino)imidazole ribonucleotide mutase
MPGGVPVGTLAIGQAKNAGLLAARILATTDDALRSRLEVYHRDTSGKVRETDDKVHAQFSGE